MRKRQSFPAELTGTKPCQPPAADGSSNIDKDTLRLCAEVASAQYPWPGVAGADVASWLDLLSTPASKTHLADAIEYLHKDKVEAAKTHLSGLLLPADLVPQRDSELLANAVAAIVQHLQATIAMKTWDAGAEMVGLSKNDQCVQVLAMDDDISTFIRRQILPMALLGADELPDFTSMLATLKAGKVLVLYGSSGAGKTYAALLLAAVPGMAKAAVYCVCGTGSIDGPLEPLEAQYRNFQACGSAAEKSARDTLAFELVKRRVDEAIPPSNRKKPPANDGGAGQDMVVVLDELGWGPDIVRGIIAQHIKLRAAIKELANCTGDVHLIIAGTGVEGVAHDIGSSTANYSAFQMRPQLWPALSKRVPPKVKALVANEGSPTGRDQRAVRRGIRRRGLRVAHANGRDDDTGG